MPSTKLGAGDFGDEVARVHDALAEHGLDVSPEERKRKFFGPTTREAVGKFQAERGMEPTCEVCGRTAEKLVEEAPPGLAERGRVEAESDNRGKAAALEPTVKAAGASPLTSGIGGEATVGANAARVSGVIALEHGSPASSVGVRLYERGFGGSKVLLNEVKTDERGAYTIPYATRGAANVEIYVVGADGAEVQLSQTKFGAQAEEQIDLIAPSAVQPPETEFKRLLTAVAPHTGSEPQLLKNASEHGNQRDFSFLASATGWDAAALALASEALDGETRTGIPADGLYALSRAGLPTDVRKLAQVSKETVTTALRRASEAGIVDAADVDKSVRAFGEFATEFKFSNSIRGALSSPKDFIDKADLSEQDREAFERAVRDDSPRDLWKRAKDNNVSDEGVAKLKLQGKLAYLTFNNAELTDYLLKVTSDPLALISKGFYEESKWSESLRELAGGDFGKLSSLIPPAFSGRTADERLDLYAAELARRVRQMDPHAVTVERIAAGKMSGVAETAGVGTFLKNATALGFKLGSTPLGSFTTNYSDDIWKGVADEDCDDVLNRVQTISALYTTSPNDDALNLLLLAGFDSATSIANCDFETFVYRIEKFRPEHSKPGDKSVTEQVYWKAQQQSATVFNVFDGLKRLNSTAYAPGSTPADAKRRDDQIIKTRKKLSGLFPTMETLFGSIDYCECSHCRSVLSPAAYLVDLLHFLDPSEEAWATVKASYAARVGAPYLKSKPFNVLNNRRPDIKNIALTCENTNTALPYIDIVNEVLEQVMMADQTLPVIEAYDVGDAPSQDLLAEPQNILWSAYVGAPGKKKGLRDLVYPITLPFDLPLETARALLRQLGLPLWRLRECVIRPDTLNPTASGRTDGWIDVWLERLGLGASDVAALSRPDKWWELFGYESQAEALKTVAGTAGALPAVSSLRNGKTLARRLSVTYEHLVELVRTRFINPEVESLIVLKTLGVDPDIIDRYLGDGKPLSSQEKSELEAWLAIQGFKPADLAPLRAAAVRKATVVLRSPSVGCDFSQTTLAFDQDPPDADQAIALVLRRMNAFVRLQKKLGWETHELDRALMALMPGSATVTLESWPDAMKTALVYLAHVEELFERFEERVLREEILVLWTDIPTTGVACLYERLFLNAGGLGRDGAFKKRLGRAPEDKNAALIDHVDAIQQALQISHNDIEPILKAANTADRALSIENLSILMRHAVLAKGLDLSIADLLVLMNLSEKRPLSRLDEAPLTDLALDVPWSETLGFVGEVELGRDAGADVAFLDRLCRHRSVDEQPDSESDPALIALAALPPGNPQKPETLQALVVQTLAAQLSASVAVVETLVEEVLKDTANKPLSDEGFSAVARAASLRKLRKALDLIQTLSVTDAEFQYLRGISGALNPDDLPLEEVTDDSTAQSLRRALTPWLELAAARRQFGRSERLLAVLEASNQSIDAVNTAAVREGQLYEAIAALTGLKLPVLALTLDAIGAKAAGGTTFVVPALALPETLRETIDAIKCFTRLGLNPTDVVRLASSPIDEGAARKLRSSVKGRYAASAWRRLAKPVFDELRKKQRDALVAHLTHLMEGDAPKYGDTPEKLFEYLLLDPGMEPVVVASRIQLAIASIQLFVQRCLMNLEETGVDPQIIDIRRWEWMRRYRVWEANRKIFIWPENWLDPEFRDDKTHLFRDLEGRLLQDDVDDDLVRSSLHTYLKGLEEIARLEMLTMYFEPGTSADGAIVHVVGRTQSGPYKYFYRKCSHGTWTPWEPIDIGIEGEHLVLTAWRGRMYLFWMSFLEQTAASSKIPATFKPGTDSVTTSDLQGTIEVKLQLHWAERLQGKWANRASTAGFVPTSFKGVKATADEDKRGFFLRAKTIEHGAGFEDDDLEIQLSNSAGTGHKFVFFSKLAGPRSELVADPLSGLPFNVEPSATKWHGSGSLKVEFVSAVKQNSETAPTLIDGEYKILGGSGDFSMLLPSNETLPVPARTPPAGVGRPCGYVFRPQNAQHVAYRSGDGNIHDLFWTKNGWFYQAPSSDVAGSGSGDTESASSDPHAYVLDDQGTICIAYSGSSRIHELVWSQLDARLDDPTLLGTGWRTETLYLAAGPADQPQGRPFGGLFMPKRGVVFRTRDGRLRAAIATGASPSWEVRDLNANLPKAASDPTGLVMTKTELGLVSVVSRHIFWIGTDGEVHELRSDPSAKTWIYTNITLAMKDAVKPAPGATPAAYAFLAQNTLHVVYRGTDSQIHELWGPPGSWNYNAIGNGFTKAKGDPAGYVTELFLTQHVVYRGDNDEVVELWWHDIWRENILTKTTIDAPKTASDVVGYSFELNKSQHVVFFGEDGDLQELWWDGSWHIYKYELSNPFPDDLVPLASPFFYEAASKDHTFFVEPYIIETAVHEWTEWIVTTSEYVETSLIDLMLIPLIPLKPDAVAVVPNDIGVFEADPTHFTHKIFDDNVIVRTSKGLIGPVSDVGAMVSEGTEVYEKPLSVRDVGRGAQRANERTRRDGNFGRL